MFQPNMQTYVAQLRNLHSLYAHLTMEYLRLPLSCRKYLYGNDSMTTSEARAMAQAKFTLAATLQWKPSYNCYNADSFMANVARPEMKTGEGAGETEDELCPIWISFFDEIIEADRLLGLAKNNLQHSTDISAYVSTVLHAAEEKFAWLYSLAMEVAQHGEFIQSPGGIELTNSMISIGWNRFCLKAARSGLADALQTVRPVRQKGNAGIEAVHSGQSSRREYFAFVPAADYRPWLQVISAPTNGLSEYHPQCAADSPCRRSPDFCPCKARGVECDNWNCSRSGPWKWPCISVQPQVAHVGVPSYAAGHNSVEDAMVAGDLCDGIVYAKPQVSMHALPAEATPMLQTYNALWESLTPIDHEVVWPTPSFELRDLKADAGLPLRDELLRTMEWDRLITLKVKAFFLSGLKIPYDVGEYPVKEAVVVPRFATFDTQRIEALMQQMLIERQRWSYEGLSRRTGTPGYETPTLGNDWLSWAVRDGIEELIECSCKAMAKAERAELYLRE